MVFEKNKTILSVNAIAYPIATMTAIAILKGVLRDDVSNLSSSFSPVSSDESIRIF